MKQEEKIKMKYDFGGWATRNDLECADGRIIKKDAFKNTGVKNVPFVYVGNNKIGDTVIPVLNPLP